MGQQQELKKKDHTLEEIAQVVKENESFVVVGHLRPDGDCLGSTLGMYFALKGMGKKVTAFNITPVGEKWDFVTGVDAIKPEFPNWTPDVILYVDCGGLNRVGDDFVQPDCKVSINLDHHLTNDRFADLNLVNTGACAAGEIVYDLVKILKQPLTPEISANLYMAILTDTGSFRFSNTSPHSLRVAAELLESGVDPSVISMSIYESRDPGELALTSVAYHNMQYEFDGFMVWSQLLKEDYEANGGYEVEPDGLSSDIRGVKGVEISCLMQQMEDGTLRAGFRGKGKVDCSAIARSLGGGGHFNAAGAVLWNLPWDEAQEKALSALRGAVAKWIQENTAA
jgi:bifunctional oligoribonuclease and PAP phosphatase NrnA